MLLLLLLWNREPKHKTVAVTQAITAKDRLQLLALSQSSPPLPIRPSLLPSRVTIGILPFRVSWIWAVHMLHTCLYLGGRFLGSFYIYPALVPHLFQFFTSPTSLSFSWGLKSVHKRSWTYDQSFAFVGFEFHFRCPTYTRFLLLLLFITYRI